MAVLSHRKLASCDSYHAQGTDERDTLYKHLVLASRRIFLFRRRVASVLFGELINIDSENYTRRETLWAKCRVFNVKPGGKYSNQCALKIETDSVYITTY